MVVGRVLLTRPLRACNVRHASGLPYRIRAPLARLQAHKEPAPAFRPAALGDGEALSSSEATPDYLHLALRSRVYEHITESPLQHAPALSESLGGVCVHIKREDMLPTFSYFARCAVNELATYSGTARLVTGSVGSRGTALAWAAERMGKQLSVVMPETSPQQRQDAIARRGAEVVLHGSSLNEAQAEALRLGASSGYALVGSHDSPAVLAATGTVGIELLRQHGGALREVQRLAAARDATAPAAHRALDAVFLGVGGGSLLAGAAATIKTLSPSTRVVAVEPKAADVLSRSLLCGHRLMGSTPDGKAGIFVSQIGPEVFRLCDRLVDDIIAVDDEEICDAVRDAFVDTRAVLEPLGAIAIAGLKSYVRRERRAGVLPTGAAYAAIASDASNIEFEFLSRVGDERASIVTMRPE